MNISLKLGIIHGDLLLLAADGFGSDNGFPFKVGREGSIRPWGSNGGSDWSVEAGNTALVTAKGASHVEIGLNFHSLGALDLDWLADGEGVGGIRLGGMGWADAGWGVRATRHTHLHAGIRHDWFRWSRGDRVDRAGTGGDRDDDTAG